jgi:phosphonate transport system substrate-binding protein
VGNLRAPVLALCVAALLLPSPVPAADPLTLVLTPSRDPTALQEAGDAFAKALTRLSGTAVKAIVAADYAGVVEALRSRRVDLAFVHPVGYVLASREAGCQILVRDIWQGKTAYTARIYVLKARGWTRLEELRGRTIAFVDPASSSGYIYPMVLLMKQGLVTNRDPKSFFKDALFAGTHEAALRALLRGSVDAAASFDTALQIHLKGEPAADQITYVAETSPIPEAGICARPGLDPAMRERLKAALLAIKKPEYASLLKQVYDIDGFIEASDRDYDPVREAMDLMGLTR